MITTAENDLHIVYLASGLSIGATLHRVDAEGLDVWESWLGLVIWPDGSVSLTERVGSFRRWSAATRRVYAAEKARAFLARCKRTAGRVLE